MACQQMEVGQERYQKSNSRYYLKRATVSPRSPQRKIEEATVAKLLVHLGNLEAKGIVNKAQIWLITRNFYILELRRRELVGHDGETVVVSNGELYFGEDLNQVMRKAREAQGDAPVYSETVNTVDYPSLLS